MPTYQILNLGKRRQTYGDDYNALPTPTSSDDKSDIMFKNRNRDIMNRPNGTITNRSAKSVATPGLYDDEEDGMKTDQ